MTNSLMAAGRRRWECYEHRETHCFLKRCIYSPGERTVPKYSSEFQSPWSLVSHQSGRKQNKTKHIVNSGIKDVYKNTIFYTRKENREQWGEMLSQS